MWSPPHAAEPALPATAAEPAAEPVMPYMEELEFGKLLVTQRCANCHGIAEGADRFAAPLHHLFGRMPASIEGYTFSINMKNIDIAWSPSTLDDWLKQTTFDTPDIRMRHVGITNEVQRTAVISYLKSLPGNAGAAPE
ncbi:MAG: hypothetical protein APF80_12545 [Alphaproteobacteria bacterium BRH_c36]|nr:MAG: hypothetical protein APF80_12545 [Alphaproteobacteria bacterium BRH_c36]